MDDREPWDDADADPDEAPGGDLEADPSEDPAEELDEEPDGEPDEELGEEADADAEAAWVYCPYCGEGVELLLDPGGGSFQEYVEDCEVCCRPWRVEVTYDEDGRPAVELFTDDE